MEEVASTIHGALDLALPVASGLVQGEDRSKRAVEHLSSSWQVAATVYENESPAGCGSVTTGQ